MNPEFKQWLEEQEYDFNYVDTADKNMDKWEESWFIKSVHDAAYPEEKYGGTDAYYAYRWSQVLTSNFTETYDK